ncbi:xanthine dehydrogenase family protein molybdopterin-binding subunit [Hahella sp. SMD15-11]|uniref:Xanthine dehydrogenase family protein molybdopterin-binding subunit n=1 Tax=Thermohahella caldifontis TaxID=3142973 RepID=A0AB39UYB7_9GAMM
MAELNMDRRTFLKVSASATGGLMMAFALPGCSTLPEGQDPASLRPNAWIEVTPDSRVILTLDRVEMGQGTMTGLCTLVGEEMNRPPESVDVVFAPVDKVYNQPVYGLQLTGGSTSMATSWQRIREAAAGCAVLLRKAAARVLDVPMDQVILDERGCTVGDRTLALGDLVALARSETLPDTLPLKPASEYRWIGRQNNRRDKVPKVFGQARYGIDVELDNMLHAVVTRPPVLEARPAILNAEEIRRMPGVVDVVEIPRGVAILAERYWQARKAREALKIDWQGGRRDLDTEAVWALYEQKSSEDGSVHRDEGNAARALERSGRVLEAEYRAPFLAHATLEPQNCTAWLRDGRLDVWAPTQGPDVARAVAMRESGLGAEAIQIHTTWIGGGFGRRLSQDYVAEAVAIATHTNRPVKVIWSREEDTRHDLYRPAALHRLQASLDDQGSLDAWRHKIVCPRIIDWFVRDAAGAVVPAWTPQMMVRLAARMAPMINPDSSPIEGAEDVPYAAPNVEVAHVQADAGIPVSYWRSVGHSHNAFAVESFIDELAHAAGEDPVEFRRRHLRNHARHLGVLNAAVAKAGWGKPAPGRYQGVACHKSFDTYVAQVAEVEVDEAAGTFRVVRMVCAVDCGTIVNPDIVVAQMQSGMIFGLTATLFGRIDFRQGGVVQSNFHDYRMLRTHEVPEMEVVLVPTDHPPTGVGEPGVPPVAPAVANALFAATGRRLRELPLELKPA